MDYRDLQDELSKLVQVSMSPERKREIWAHIENEIKQAYGKPKRERRSWTSVLWGGVGGAAAAVVIGIVLLSSKSPVHPPNRFSASAAVVSEPVAYEQLAMVTSHTGWARTRGGDILRTDGGPAGWHTETLPNLHRYTAVSTYFRSQDAWVAASNQTNQTVTVYFTHNSGQTWGTSTVQLPTGTVVKQLDFINSSVGWILTKGSSSAAMEIFRTEDGGRNWTVVYPNASVTRQGGKAGTESLVGEWSELSFTSDNLGWMTFVPPGKAGPQLARTNDAGANWTPVSFQKPAGLSQLSAPIFSGATGIMPAVVHGREMFYRSTDTGETWNLLPPANLPQGGLDFVDANHGWLSAYESTQGIYRTSDGGGQWQHLNAVVPGRYATLDFITDNTGFAYIEGKSGTPDAVWMTHDGGNTWTRMDSRVLRKSS